MSIIQNIFVLYSEIDYAYRTFIIVLVYSCRFE